MIRSVLLAVLLSVLLPMPAHAVVAPPGPSQPGPAVAGPSLAGGDILSRPGGYSCQLSFNLSGRNILTSSRCGPVGTRWYAGNVSVGVVTTVLSGKDAAILHIDNPAVVQLAAVRLGRVLGDVTGAARAYVGQRVTYHSPTAGTRSGLVTGINQTVNLPQGVLTGLDRVNLCAQPRDGGAPVIAGPIALSLVAGGSGCSGGGGALFAQPVVPVLTATGLALLTA